MTFPENWTPPRELTRALPREIRMTRGSITVAIVAAILVLGSIPMFVFFRSQNERDKARAKALRDQGREASGQIVRLWRTGGKSNRRMVTYSFTADGIRLHADASVPENIWRDLRTNSDLPIRYLPFAPYVSHPAAWDLPTQADWLPFIPATMIGGAGIVFLFFLRRQARLAAEGVPAPGVVTKCSKVKDGWAVSYQFRMKDGTEGRGSGQTTRRLDEGTAICILYLEQDPRRNSIYPTNFYRVAS